MSNFRTGMTSRPLRARARAAAPAARRRGGAAGPGIPHGGAHEDGPRSVAANGDRRRGFTLLEVLVALAVLSVMLMALYQAFSSNIFITSFTGNLWKAITYTQNELLRLERSAPPPVSIHEGDFEEDHPMYGFHWKREVVPDSPFPGITVRKVTLELSWEEGGARRSYQGKIFVTPL